jgi:phosphatidylserine/phosphatidylglycerophosphate/cardiolipin synthase-like enzyme
VDPLLDLLLSEPANRVAAFQSALAEGRVGLESTRVALQRRIVGSAKSYERMLAVLHWWKHGGGSPKLLALAIATLLQAREEIENRGPSCELVWTGPGPTTEIRSTAQVIDEMLDHSRRSVFAVSYSVWIGSFGTRFFERLGDLSAGGVVVSFLVDASYQDGWSIRQIQANWPRGTPPARVFSWSDPRDEIAKLHAKVLLVDSRDMLVTSANLTEHAMAGNIEFGIRVQGTPAANAARHFEALLRSPQVEGIG